MADRGKDRQVDIEQLSPEKLEKEIEKNKKKAIKSFAFAVAAAVALIALCIAWFVSNNRVNGILGGISAKKSGIEIGSKGSKGVHDDILQKVKKSDLTYHLPDEENNFQHDTSSGGSINWLLKQESNMNNYSDGKSFKETGARFRKDYAMEPGTKGRLDFFIKSYEEGNLSLDFSLDIVPYVMNGDTTQAVDKTSTASQFLSGHIAYFLGETQNDTVNYTWIRDGRFQITIPKAEKDKEYNYSIYWVWPLNLSTILLNENDEFLNGSTIEFDDKDATGALRNQIVTDMTENPGKYFFNSLKEAPLDTDYEEIKAIRDIHANSTYDKQLFVDLSSYYNQADMKIGESISFITATLKYLGKTEETNEKTEAKNED